jgi:hypothetical protein
LPSRPPALCARGPTPPKARCAMSHAASANGIRASTLDDDDDDDGGDDDDGDGDDDDDDDDDDDSVGGGVEDEIAPG